MFVARSVEPEMSRYVPFIALGCLTLAGQTDLHSADWPQFGGSSHRNAVADGNTLPASWDVATGRNSSSPISSSSCE